MFCGGDSTWVGPRSDLESLTGSRRGTLAARHQRLRESARSISGSHTMKAWRWWRIIFNTERSFKESMPIRLTRAPGKIFFVLLTLRAHCALRLVVHRGMDILLRGGEWQNTKTGDLRTIRRVGQPITAIYRKSKNC